MDTPNFESLVEKLVAVKRVSKTVKGGRHFSFAAITVVGDGHGFVGLGYSKAKEVPVAIQKSVEGAKKTLVKVPLREGTFFYAIEGRHGGTTVVIRPAADGTGIIAGGAMRPVFEALGVKNVLSKIIGSRNHINVIRATLDAFSKIESPEHVAMKRGLTHEA